jgi:ribosomal protein L11 methyltransferase
MSTPPLPRFPRVALDVPTDLADEVSFDLFEMSATGVEVRDGTTLEQASVPGTVTLLASFSTEQEAASAIEHLSASWNPRRDDVVGDAWRDGWKEHFKPFYLTPSIVIRPPWVPFEASAGVHVLEMDPGRAFGTGLHPTTRLVARSLEKNAGRLAGTTVLDVGCGSGVLAFCALVLGAKRARAVDNDPEAAIVTRENAERNGLGHRVEADTTDVAAVEASFPFVVANIEARVLIPMAGALVARVATGGLLVLSGVLQEQVDDVVAAYGALRVIEVLDESGWVAIELEAER